MTISAFAMIFTAYKEFADVQIESERVLALTGKMKFCFRVSEKKELESCRALTIQNSIFGSTNPETAGKMVEETINYALLMLTEIK